MGQRRHDIKFAKIKQSKAQRDNANEAAQAAAIEVKQRESNEITTLIATERFILQEWYDWMDAAAEGDYDTEVYSTVREQLLGLDRLQAELLLDMTNQVDSQLNQVIAENNKAHANFERQAIRDCKYSKFGFQVLRALGGLHVQVAAGTNAHPVVQVGFRPPAMQRHFVGVWQQDLAPPISTANRQAYIEKTIITDLNLSLGLGYDAIDTTPEEDTEQPGLGVGASSDSTRAYESDEGPANPSQSQTSNPILEPSTGPSEKYYTFIPNRDVLEKYSMGPDTVKVVEAQDRNGNWLLRDPHTGRFAKSFLRQDMPSMLQKFNEKLKGELEIAKNQSIVSFQFDEVFSEVQIRNTIKDVFINVGLRDGAAGSCADWVQQQIRPNVRPFAERVATWTVVAGEKTGHKGIVGVHAGVNLIDATPYKSVNAKINVQVSVLTGYARMKGQLLWDQEGREQWDLSAGLGGFVLASNISSKIGELCLGSLCAKIEHNIMLGVGLSAETGVGCSNGTCYMNAGLGPVSNQFKWKILRKSEDASTD